MDHAIQEKFFVVRLQPHLQRREHKGFAPGHRHDHGAGLDVAPDEGGLTTFQRRPSAQKSWPWLHELAWFPFRLSL